MVWCVIAIGLQCVRHGALHITRGSCWTVFKKLRTLNNPKNTWRAHASFFFFFFSESVYHDMVGWCGWNANSKTMVSSNDIWTTSPNLANIKNLVPQEVASLLWHPDRWEGGMRTLGTGFVLSFFLFCFFIENDAFQHCLFQHEQNTQKLRQQDTFVTLLSALWSTILTQARFTHSLQHTEHINKLSLTMHRVSFMRKSSGQRTLHFPGSRQHDKLWVVVFFIFFLFCLY